MNEILSMIAVTLAAVSLGWNIYKDLIGKYSRVRVTGMIANIVTYRQEVDPTRLPDQIVISAVNHGPGDTTLSIVSLRIKKTSFFAKKEHATVLCDHTNPLSARLPCELRVGKQAQFVFPFDSKSFLRMDLSSIGISDLYRKTHRMKTRNVKELRSRWCKEFEGVDKT